MKQQVSVKEAMQALSVLAAASARKEISREVATDRLVKLVERSPELRQVFAKAPSRLRGRLYDEVALKLALK